MRNAHEAKALALSCIDFRLIDEVTESLENHLFENKETLKNNLIISFSPGASLGPNACVGRPEFQCWRDAFCSVLRASKRLHDIERLVIIDHMGCGQYRNIYSFQSRARSFSAIRGNDQTRGELEMFHKWYKDEWTKSLQDFEVRKPCNTFYVCVQRENEEQHLKYVNTFYNKIPHESLFCKASYLM